MTWSYLFFAIVEYSVAKRGVKSRGTENRASLGNKIGAYYKHTSKFLKLCDFRFLVFIQNLAAPQIRQFLLTNFT